MTFNNFIRFFCITSLFLVSCAPEKVPTCSTGQHFSSTTLICVPDCSADKIFTNGSCQSCGYGLIPNPDQTQCVGCQAGFYNNTIGASVCLPCMAGTYSDPGSTSCVSCGPGSYASASGSASCSVCPANTYNSNSGAISCIPCPGGTTPNADATACI